MTAKIINCKKLSDQIMDELKADYASFAFLQARAPTIALLTVGQSAPTLSYINSIVKSCDKLGFHCLNTSLDASISAVDLKNTILHLNNDTEIDSLLLGQPLPEHLRSYKLERLISIVKDVDACHPFNIGKLAQGTLSIKPCTPHAIMKILHSIKPNLTGLCATVVGASSLVGKPIALELINANCTVCVCHLYTEDLAPYVHNADIVISAAGKAGLIQGEWIKKGAIVIDAGINETEDHHIVGDVDFKGASKHADYITQVPHGVGLVTQAILMQNIYQAWKRKLVKKK